jgi:hypothetical protein
MKGYVVITSDEKKAGRVVDEVGDILIVEHGTLHKVRLPLPRVFANVDDAAQVVRATVSSRTLEDAPELRGDELDLDPIARHYGLAGSDPDPPTHGYGEVLPDDPAEPAPDDAELRASRHSHLRPGEGPDDHLGTPGLLGDH